MKKHQVNHPLEVPKRRELRRRPKASRTTAVGTAILATLALTLSPTMQGRQADAAPYASTPVDAQLASYARPVEVSLLSGVDAIRWESENITSAAAGAQLVDASDPGALIGSPGAAARLVGQNVGPLGVLPAGIQLIHPVSSRHITSPYGWRNNPTGAGTQIHIGQDYAISCGSPVYASADGVVVQSAWAGHSGMRVTIDHGSSVRTGYSHNSKLIASVGQSVKQGQLIALSGTTGNSTGCHVHFEVIINGRWNDPRNFLPSIPGQPNPMIDSRRTTIAAEPIRNTGDPKPESHNGHDIDMKMPEPSKAPPSATAPDKESSSPTPSESSAPSTSPKPKPTPSTSPTPTPSTSPTPKPDPSPTVQPEPTAKPTPTKSPAPEPSKETTAPETATPATPPTESTESQPVETQPASTPKESPDSSSSQGSGATTGAPSSTPTESP